MSCSMSLFMVISRYAKSSSWINILIWFFFFFLMCSNFNAVIAVSFSGSSGGFFSHYLVKVVFLVLHSKVNPIQCDFPSWFRNNSKETKKVCRPLRLLPSFLQPLMQHPSLRRFLSALSWKSCQMCKGLDIRNMLAPVLGKFISSSSSANSHLGEGSDKQSLATIISRLEKLIPFLWQCWHGVIWLSFLQLFWQHKDF